MFWESILPSVRLANQRLATGKLLLLVAGYSHFSVDSANQQLTWHRAEQGAYFHSVPITANEIALCFYDVR